MDEHDGGSGWGNEFTGSFGAVRPCCKVMQFVARVGLISFAHKVSFL